MTTGIHPSTSSRTTSFLRAEPVRPRPIEALGKGPFPTVLRLVEGPTQKMHGACVRGHPNERFARERDRGLPSKAQHVRDVRKRQLLPLRDVRDLAKPKGLKHGELLHAVAEAPRAPPASCVRLMPSEEAALDDVARVAHVDGQRGSDSIAG
eukprot:CAMPEP_0115833110 /NCGR_PEP_ID=MMETSP0287-20121206/3004_1 /TAXON_ID=412157 /ORGANISM="Chrysochromulina rotalis, Strain UIO044" /LENGTH=151 /DNA_ID=CAMNT_0003286515 /DNA_START=164 /DNA_END=619 /DNA_ORIENTATION=+